MTTTDDHEAFARLLDQVERALAPTPPPCPDCCTKPACHEYDSTDYDLERYSGLTQALVARDIVACRYHRRHFLDGDDEAIDVTQLERAAVRPGVEPVVSLDEATVWADIARQDEMSVEGARVIAQAFTAAAALVERLNS